MAIHRINIVSGIQPDGPTNLIDCCQVCQTATVTFINDHNSSLTINNFIIDAVGSGLSISVTAINGLPPSFPFVVAIGATFTFDIEFCHDGVTDPLGPWGGTLVTAQHENELEWTFEMDCVQWPTIWDNGGVSYFDFTDTPVGSTNSQSITLSNPTIGPVSISLDFSGCGSPDPEQLPRPAILPPGGTGAMTVVWTPTDVSDFISCGPDLCGVSFSTTGTAIAIPCECLCCLDVQIQTDGSYLNTDVGFCNPDTVYSKSAFLDKKTVIYSMKYGNPMITGWRLQFNPALFGLECISPFEGNNTLPVGYFIQYLSGSHPDGTDQPMVLNGAASNALNLRNWDVRFRPTNAAAGEFNVEFTFYMTQDFEQFLTNITFDNSFKLRRNTLSAAANYDNSFPSVYNSPKALQAAFHVTDPATLVGDSPFRCGMLTCSSFTGRFYNKGLNDGPSEFTNPVFTLSRTNGAVTNFSTIENTKVQFSVFVPAIYGAARPDIVFHLFDENGFDNAVDFFSATDSSRAYVASLPGTGVVNNHLVRPGALGNVGADWMCSLHVGTTVNASSSYRMAAIVYGSNGEMVNTFLSEPINVTRIPDQDCDCELDIESRWNQYFQSQETDCFRPVGKERIGHRLIVNGGDFADCITNWGFDVANWMDRLLLVTLRIYKRRENFPMPGKTTFFQYEQHQSVASNAFPSGFSDSGAMRVQRVGPSFLETVIADRRVRWESNIFSGGQISTALTSQYMNRVNAGPLGGIYASTLGMTDSWINNDVFFEYTFTFNFSADVNAPLFWNIVKAFKLNAIDFEPINSGFEQRLTDVTFEGQDPTTGVFLPIEPPYCFNNYSSIRLTYQADREGNFLFFIEPEPFGIAVIQENDEIGSPTDQTQLMTPLVLSQDTTFDPVTLTAQVILNSAQFTNQRYLFCGYISSPEVPATCQYFLFHTKNAGSSLIVVPTPQVGDTITGTFNNVTAGRTLTIRSSNGDTVYPIPGTTYVFEYSFSIPTTRPLDFRFGTLSTSGPIDETLPVGTTNGSFTMVWGADTNGFWTMFTGAGTDMTGTFAFKIGNQLCP